MRIIKHLPWSNLTIAYRRMHKIVMLHCEIKSIWRFVTLIITQVINFTQKSDVSIEIIISQRPERYTNHHKLASLHLHRIANIPTNQKRELEEVKSREHPLVRKHRYFPKKRKTECKRKWKPVFFYKKSCLWYVSALLSIFNRLVVWNVCTSTRRRRQSSRSSLNYSWYLEYFYVSIIMTPNVMISFVENELSCSAAK